MGAWWKGAFTPPRMAIATNLALIVLGAILMVGIAVGLKGQTDDHKAIMCYLGAGALAGMVGFGELLSRYQDAPLRLFRTFATSSYMLVNITAGIMALDIIRILHVLEPAAHAPADPAVWLKQTLLASFGAVAFFRTSLFNVRVGSSDVGIGPSALLQALLNAADRMIDRDQAKTRAEHVKTILEHVDYRLARAPLPAFCMVLMQNPAADQDAMSRQVAVLDARNDMSDDTKIMMVGVYLIRLVGAEVLQRSVEALGMLIAKSGAPPCRQSDMMALMNGLDYAQAKTLLVAAVLKKVPGSTQQDIDAANQQVAALDARKDITDQLKMMLLGAYLISVVGLETLGAIVGEVGAEIKKK